LGIFDIRIEEAMDRAIVGLYEQGIIPEEDTMPTLAEDMLWGQETLLGSEVSEILTEWLIARLEKRILGVKTNPWDEFKMQFMGS